MTANEVMAGIRTLRPEDRAAVLDQLLEIQSAQAISYVEDTRFDQAMEIVLSRHADLMRKLAQ